MNALISSSFMHYPKQEITFKDTKVITKNLYVYIKDRGFKTYISATPQNFDIM